MNKIGLYGLEVFQLSFPGTNIFLEVCDILDRDSKYVRIRELETYEMDDCDMLSLSESGTKFKVKPMEECLLDQHEFYYIKNDNSFLIPIEIKFGSKLYNYVQSKCYNYTIPSGIYYASMIGDGRNESFYSLVKTAFERRVIPGDSDNRHWA